MKVGKNKMLINEKNKENSTKIFEIKVKDYFLVFFMILSFSPIIKQNQIYFISTIFILLYINQMNFKIEKTKILKYLGLIILMFLTTIFTETFLNKNQASLASIIYLLNFFIGYFISSVLTWKLFYKCYIKIMLYLSLFSIVIFFIIIFFPSVIKYGYPLMLDYGNSELTKKSILIYNFIIIKPDQILGRNTGIAWEPGAFQFLVNLALGLSIKYEKKIFSISKAIFILTVLTTKSTTGIITLGFLLIYICKDILKKKITRVFPMGILTIFAIIQGIKNNFFKYHIFEKLDSSNKSGGFSVREEAFSQGFNSVVNSPILGVGSRLYLEKSHAYDSYSILLGMYGIIFFTYYFSILIWNYRKNILILIVILMGFTNEVIWQRILLTYLFFIENKE